MARKQKVADPAQGDLFASVKEAVEVRAEAPASNAGRCAPCTKYFSMYSCGKDKGEGECDCPKCQGICECAVSVQLKAGDAVVDVDGFMGTVVEWDGEELPTPLHVFVKVAKNHPLAYMNRPVSYAVSQLRKIEK